MKALYVQPEKIEKAWPLVERMIEHACKRGKSDFDARWVKKWLERGQLEMFMAWDYDTNRCLGIWIVEFSESPRGKYMNFLLTAGKDFKRWRHLIESVKEYAVEQGCNRIQCGGRLGWERALRSEGWKKLWCVMELRLDHA